MCSSTLTPEQRLTPAKAASPETTLAHPPTVCAGVGSGGAGTGDGAPSSPLPGCSPPRTGLGGGSHEQQSCWGQWFPAGSCVDCVCPELCVRGAVCTGHPPPAATVPAGAGVSPLGAREVAAIQAPGDSHNLAAPAGSSGLQLSPWVPSYPGAGGQASLRLRSPPSCTSIPGDPS